MLPMLKVCVYFEFTVADAIVDTPVRYQQMASTSKHQMTKKERLLVLEEKKYNSISWIC